MVLAATVVFAAETDVERRHAEMLKEGRVVGAGTQRPDGQLSPLFRGGQRGSRHVLAIKGRRSGIRAKPFEHALTCFRIGDVCGCGVDQMLEILTAGCVH